MKEVETTMVMDGVWNEPERRPVYRCIIRVSDVTVGRMRVWDDWESFEDSVPVPKAVGKVSVRPYVRGKPRKRSTLETTEPPAQPQSDSEGVIRKARSLEERVGAAFDKYYQSESQDPRIADVFKRLDHEDCLGSTIR